MKLDPTLKADWQQIHSGWWVALKPNLGVSKEDDGKWHSYIRHIELPKDTPGFRTMREAMIDAEKRYADSGEKGAK